jgi:hypothetical protein
MGCAIRTVLPRVRRLGALGWGPATTRGAGWRLRGGSLREPVSSAPSPRRGGARPPSAPIGSMPGTTPIVAHRSPPRPAPCRSARSSMPAPLGPRRSFPPPGVPRRALSPEERAVHAVQRLTFGADAATLAEARAAGADAFIERQLAWQSIDDRACDDAVRQLSSLSMSAEEIDRHERAGSSASTAGRTAPRSRSCGTPPPSGRSSSRRQLYEVMVRFWSDHLNIWPAKDPTSGSPSRSMIATSSAAHAMGRFADLLQASARARRLLRYHGRRAQHRRDAQRELRPASCSSCHTMGVGTYSEQEVRACALVLTGWGIDEDHHTFRFAADQHHSGPATVAGWSTQGTGGVRRRRGPPGPPRPPSGDRRPHRPQALHPLRRRRSARGARALGGRHLPGQRPPPSCPCSATSSPATPSGRAPAPSSASRSTTSRPRCAPAAPGSTCATAAPPSPSDQSLAALDQRLFDWAPPDGYPDRRGVVGRPAGRARPLETTPSRWPPAACRGSRSTSASLADPTSGRTAGAVVDSVLARLVPGPTPGGARSALLGLLEVGADAPFEARMVDRLPELGCRRPSPVPRRSTGERQPAAGSFQGTVAACGAGIAAPLASASVALGQGRSADNARRRRAPRRPRRAQRRHPGGRRRLPRPAGRRCACPTGPSSRSTPPSACTRRSTGWPRSTAPASSHPSFAVGSPLRSRSHFDQLASLELGVPRPAEPRLRLGRPATWRRPRATGCCAASASATGWPRRCGADRGRPRWLRFDRLPDPRVGVPCRRWSRRRARCRAAAE